MGCMTLPSRGQCNIVSIVIDAAGGRNSVVECLLPKQDVVGSNPIARSITSEAHGRSTVDHGYGVCDSVAGG